MCETDEFKPITDTKIKELLKNIVRNCINLKENDDYDFSDAYISSSNFDFCPVETQFFVSDEKLYSDNLTNYCIRNNYNKLFAINTEFIDNESIIPNSIDYPYYLAYEYNIDKCDLLRIGRDFTYGLSALLFPEDLSFLVLLTFDYDIIVGKREFIEEIIKEDLVEVVDRFEQDISFIMNDGLKKISDKYKNLIHSKYG